MAPALGQGFKWPEEPKNLQILRGLFGDELGGVMRSFSQALGVRCNHCHVGKEGEPFDANDLSTFDFAADKSEHKQATREMLKMTRVINETYIATVQPKPERRVEVRCVTCHRGQEKPRLIEDLLAAQIDSRGAEGGVAMYRELRAKHYGGFAYDFSEGMLTRVADGLASRGKTDEALRMLDLELELYPSSARAYMAKGGLLAKQGNREQAIESLEKALELSPDPFKPFVRQELERVKGQ